AVHLDPGRYASREEHDAALLDELRGASIDVVCLAGYMRILSPPLVRAFWGRMVNIHPSLLPAFPGAHAVRDALAWGVRVTGCTVHLVDEEVDHGPILAQETVGVLPDDDEETLHARIQEAEHRLYPRTVRALVERRVRLEGRRAVVR
ncbi:MAG TPA: phosphoribosylglycinamide formyltransferase, partial [Actinomycetota bacterium]|nr:phosphoribosylglycinamide formyltransferase [Actinomycetota bacterium]